MFKSQDGVKKVFLSNNSSLRRFVVNEILVVKYSGNQGLLCIYISSLLYDTP